MQIHILLLILIAHFVGDFLLQSDEMAKNKSSSWGWLSEHVLIYSVTLLALVMVLGIISEPFNYPYPSNYPYLWGDWILINAALHFVTDAITSRGTAWLYKNNERHWFFVLIGFDQLLHYAALILTYPT